VRLAGTQGKVKTETRTFQTMTDQILALGDWLRECEVAHVAMGEHRGVPCPTARAGWKPIYNVLEQDFELPLVNPAHMNAVLARPGNVPGRKTDVQDAEWIADLLAHGLLRASYVPDRPRREVRELVRYRRSLVGERTAEVNRLHKVLEGANIKLGSVAERCHRQERTGDPGRAASWRT
jgi:hypothetical protein